jgi:selenide,water dikinase
MDWREIRLTETVKKGGCAAKLPAGQLGGLLGSLALRRPPQLAIGIEKLDDACLWDLGPDAETFQLVQTLDFFTPIVDDAYDFGAIAAANAISDVYAMGGSPKIALSILAFPAQTLPLELLQPLMEGALEKIHEAGACLAGGHTIDDETLKLGFSVTGFVRKGRAWGNAGAREGDGLLLTKGLGTGTITTALKVREAKAEWVEDAVRSMKQLNAAVDLLDGAGIDVHAATDVTGFGLSGHATQLAQASGVSLRIDTPSLPKLTGALDSLRDGNLNRAHRTNQDYCAGKVHFAPRVSEEERWLSYDPQTSGGLLLSVPSDQCGRALEALRPRFPRTARIGTVEARAAAETVTYE